MSSFFRDDPTGGSGSQMGNSALLRKAQAAGPGTGKSMTQEEALAFARANGAPYAGWTGGVNTPTGARVTNALNAIDPTGISGGVLDTALGAVSAPKTYDVAGNLNLSTAAAGNVYNAAMEQVNSPNKIQELSIRAPDAIQADHLKTVGVTADTIANPNAITAQNVEASGLVAGQPADELRQQALTQAAAAASSPSSAAAQMRAAGTQIEQQQAGMAAQARGADRAGARRAAMLGTGQQGMQAASTTAALAAQEQAQKQQAYTSALAGVRAGDVTAANTLASIGAQNQQANLTAQTTTEQQRLATAQANQAAKLQAATTSGNQYLTAAGANQQADLQAAMASGQQYLTAAQANQQANLSAQQYSAQNLNAQENTALQAVGATTQAQGVASGAAAGQDQLKSKTGGGLLGAAGSLLGMSDERAKQDVSPIGSGKDNELDSLMESSYGDAPDLGGAYGLGVEGADSPYSFSERLGHAMQGLGATLQDRPQPPALGAASPAGQNFLNWQPPKPSTEQSSQSSGGGLGGLVSGVKSLIGGSDERGKTDIDRMMVQAEPPSARRKKATELEFSTRDNPPAHRMAAAERDSAEREENQYLMSHARFTDLSDERAKRDVDRMSDEDLVNWADRVPAVTFRYKRGVEDGGAVPHVGTTAQALERSGPLGRMMVSRGPDGLRRVDYGALAYMQSKAALAKAEKGARHDR